MARRKIIRIFGFLMVLFAVLAFYGTFRDLRSGEVQDRRGPVTRESRPDEYLLKVGLTFGVGIVALGAGLYLVMRPD